ncbi:hypothetical protein, partial [Glaesserella parasuis]|uniref:hypothetical protein n=1 Tax=Glaesserella parasuis TaxID=738 RepID=UPI003F350E5D
EEAWARARESKETRTAASLPTKDGVYIEFVGQAGYDLVTKSLENRRSGIRLLNVKKSEEVFSATVYIPAGKESHFLNKIQAYLTGPVSESTNQPK